MIEPKYQDLFDAWRVVVYISLAKRLGRGADTQIIADAVAEEMIPYFVEYNGGFVKSAVKKDRDAVKSMLAVAMADKEPSLQGFKDIFESYAG